VPHFLISEPAEMILRVLGEALDLVNVGILLLDPDLRTRFINQHLQDMLNISPDI
jgi:PAS domain-containing protein